ncbi:MAG: hypothetical protein IT185_00620, partial [Acidobacteria bacterium]|nr:hypothetical protein [Acidobacteriota bacterium]
MAVPASLTHPAERPFAGQHVAVLGKGGVLSRRDMRALVERLGGTCAFSLSDHTTIVIRTGDAPAAGWPAHVREVLTEDAVCRAAGLPDLEMLRTRYYSARDLQGMYPGLREDHLRYLGKWGLIRPVAGRYSFNDLHVIKAAAADLAKGVPLNGILRGLTAERTGQLAFDFQPTRMDSPRARVVSLPTARRDAQGAADRAAQIQSANYTLAAKYFLEGAELDDGDERNLDLASASYRR